MRLIDVATLLKKIKEISHYDDYDVLVVDWDDMITCIDVDEAPTVDAEPVRHGKWISHGSYFTCSVCGEEQYGIDTGRYYCQNCGAKMEQEESDEADISGND